VSNLFLITSVHSVVKKYVWGRNEVDFDCMTSGYLQMLYVKSKYSTDVVASTKLCKQAYLVIWGFILSLLTMFTEEVKPFLSNVIFSTLYFCILRVLFILKCLEINMTSVSILYTPTKLTYSTLIFKFMFSICFEPEGSSSGRWLHIMLYMYQYGHFSTYKLPTPLHVKHTIP